MGKQRQKRNCGHCVQCQVKTDCGKCIFCINKKAWKKKCKFRRCLVYEKLPCNPKNYEHKWTFTLQISNKLIESCYNQEYGTKSPISGTIYEDTIISRDHEKVVIEIEDSSNIMQTRTVKSNHHSFVDIAFSEDSWTMRTNSKPRPLELITNTAIKLESFDDTSSSFVSHNPPEREKVEDIASCTGDFEEEHSETVLVNFTDEISSDLDEPKQYTETFSGNEAVTIPAYEQTYKEKHVIRSSRKSVKPITYQEDSFTNDEESFDDNFEKTTPFEKNMLCQVNIKSEPQPEPIIQRQTSLSNNYDQQGYTESNGGAESEPNEDNENTDEYTLSSDDEYETDMYDSDSVNKHVKNLKRKLLVHCNCGFKSTDRSALKEHKNTCRSGQNKYLIRIKCPVCNMMYKYSRSGIIKHIKACHKKEDDKFHLEDKIRQNLSKLGEVDDDMVCEVCHGNFSKVSYPLHIQWEHFDQNFEKSQELLANYFSSEINIDELVSKYLAIKSLRVAVSVNNTLSEDTESQGNIFVINVKCPICDIMIKFNESEVCKHINESHSVLDNNLIRELKQNMKDLANTMNDNLSCEFCTKVCTKAFYPLHIQWKHSERNFERSQDILRTYFDKVMSINELESQSMVKEADISVIVQGSTVLNLETTSCEYCGKIVGQTKMIKHHESCYKNPQRQVLSHTYHCKCGFKSLQISVIKEHKDMCEKGNAFYVMRVPCPICRNIYKYSKGSVIRHLKDHHKDEPQQAEFIKKMTDNVAEWESTGDKTLSCEFCYAKCSKIYYPFHVQWEHSDRNVIRSQLILDNYFENVMSVKEFDSIQMYKNSEVSLIVLAKDGKNFSTGTCEYCGKVTERKKLAIHLKQCAKNPQRKKLHHCECGFRSQNSSSMIEHKKICKREPYVCDICGKKMKSKSHYFCHRKYDHGIISARGTAIKNYPCEDCDRVFHLPARLRIHRIRRHSNEKNYICEFCSRAYKFPTALNNHIQFAHKNIYKFYCEKCGHGMNKKSSVRKHICGRTRRRLKQHEKWMENLVDKDCKKSAKCIESTTVEKCDQEMNFSNLYNKQNDRTKCEVNQDLEQLSEQYFTPSSEVNPKYHSLSSLNQKNIDIECQVNSRENVNQTEAMIFPMQSTYVNLHPSVLPSYQYPSFRSENEVFPTSSQTNVNNNHTS